MGDLTPVIAALVAVDTLCDEIHGKQARKVLREALQCAALTRKGHKRANNPAEFDTLRWRSWDLTQEFDLQYLRQQTLFPGRDDIKV